MKHFKFICLTLVFSLCFISSAGFYKDKSEPKVVDSYDNFDQDDTAEISAPDLGISKDLDIHSSVKKKIKYRATASESCTIKTPYLSRLVHFRIFKSSLIYGIGSIYQIQRHTHLHLYQLF